jgi:hypothetical protein
MEASVVLCPHAAKRLIARGVAAHPLVAHAVAEGTVVVTLGTTNAYVADELLGKAIDHGAFAAGVIDDRWNINARIGEAKEIVIQGGAAVEVEAEALLSSLGPDDVIIKGGNALDPFGTVGVLMASPTGGTVGRYVASALARGVGIVIPISVGKSIHASIADLALQMGSKRIELAAGLPSGIYPLTGHVVSEIEALELLYDVHATHVASGGIGAGAGSVSLLLEGEADAVREAFAFIESLGGEEEPVVQGRK